MMTRGVPSIHTSIDEVSISYDYEVHVSFPSKDTQKGVVVLSRLNLCTKKQLETPPFILSQIRANLHIKQITAIGLCCLTHPYLEVPLILSVIGIVLV